MSGLEAEGINILHQLTLGSTEQLPDTHELFVRVRNAVKTTDLLLG